MLHPTLPSFKPSVQSLYLRTLILDLVNAGNLTPVQVEIADGWFSSWCGDYALDTDYSSRSHLFFVDLASERGLHLMRKDSHGDSVRYVRADSLKAQLEEVQAGLRHGRLYAGHGAGAVFPVEEHVALLAIIEKLYQSMIAGAENRIEERTRFEDREIDVVVGHRARPRQDPPRPRADARRARRAAPSSASEMVEISPSGLSLTEVEAAPAPAVAIDPDVQTWRVNDLSSKGYGLLVEKALADMVMLNGIIGLRNQVTGGWILGSVVRKLANRVRGEILAGVEVLSFRPLRVELAPVEGGPAIEALYLPGFDATGKLDSIVDARRRLLGDHALPPRGGRGHLPHPAEPHREEGRRLGQGPLRDRVEVLSPARARRIAFASARDGPVDLHAVPLAQDAARLAAPPPDAHAVQRERRDGARPRCAAASASARLAPSGRSSSRTSWPPGSATTTRTRISPPRPRGAAARRSASARSMNRSTIVSIIWPNTGPITASSARLENA